MAKSEHLYDKIKLHGPIEVGQRAEITATLNGQEYRMKTSTVEDYYISASQKIIIETKNSMYTGALENPKMLEFTQIVPLDTRNERRFDKIRANEPVVIGEKASLTVESNGERREIFTSTVEDCYLSIDGNIKIKTKNSAYVGELENPEIFSVAGKQQEWKDFDNAVSSMPQPGGMHQ